MKPFAVFVILWFCFFISFGRVSITNKICTIYTYKYKIRHKNYTKVQNNTTKVRITNGKMHNKNI